MSICRITLIALAVVGWTASHSFADEAPSPAALEFFEKKVRPLLVDHCYECHGEKKQRGGLRVDSREFLLQGTDNGPGFISGRPDESRFMHAVRYEDDLKMPPKAKLPQESIDILAEWIKQGAPWPASTPTAGTKSADPLAWKGHWSFQPVHKPALPAVKNAGWTRNEIDYFILAKLEEKGITPSPTADRRTLLRRAYFDVIGLPPTFAEVQAFEQDQRPNAYELAIDHLLASPHYGERWARHWLDVARYADTKGYVFQEDRNYPQAYLYRDWVVKALNADVPYDQFLMKQIAADQLVTEADQSDLAAMGFLTLGRRFLNNINDIIDDRIDVVMRGTMGMTVNCARCHDHKYDPIPTQDYYSLYGVFASSDEPKDGAYPQRLVDSKTPHNVQIFVRGNSGNRGAEAPRRFILAVAGEQRKNFEKGSGRFEMAQAITSPDNPLTARVFANRLWAHYFGVGLVNTPSDFGLRSSPPSHPELLDELAREFMDSKWSIKQLHKRILLSATYQQSSESRPAAEQIDSENRLVWKMNRRRLEFEGMRDNLLAVSGQLDPAIGGPAVQLEAAPFPKRRTIYGFIDRQNLPGLFRTFDLASPDAHTPQRFTTTVPQQALYMLNSPFLLEILSQLANRSEVVAVSDVHERIRRMYQLVYSRQPSTRELELGAAYIQAALAAPPVELAELSPWQYGYGEFDATTNRLKSFQAIPKWTGKTWQGQDQLPDPHLGWVSLNATGGHPGNDLQHAVIRRWTVPHDGTLAVRGRLKHGAGEGDGVLSRVISNRTGVVGEWTAQKSEADTKVEGLAVQAGDQLDFYTDCRTNPNHDSFEWTFKLRLEPTSPNQRSEWSSQADFQGPPPSPLPVWERYAQVLLMANEFVFVD
ncbi:MAG: PSD1 and planctomycete cytochrome C domain-containing protein [Planctomycetota bacterium]